ncbi:Rne/Rng family ribonuclease, partial [Candidatus Cyanaurora vandensis]
MPKQIIIAEQHRLAAVFSEEQIQELIVAKGNHQVGDIYMGVVENVLPSIDAAFVNIGNAERNGFIHVTDLGPIRQRRSSSPITELVAPQQKVLVQVMKEPTGNKGPRLTGNITLPGRFLVLMPNGRGVNLSRRIRDEDQRHRLRALAILIKPEGMGLLVRTEAEGVDEQAILDDLEILKQQWDKIQQKAQVARAPAMLNRDEDFIQRVLRDTYSNQVNRIVVDSAFGQKRVKQYLIGWNGGKMPQGLYVEHHRENSSMLDYYRVNAAIREALKPRVDLPSGGYVVIEPTEALIVIDVNSGSFTRSATSRETVLWTNCEAATEIARQLRLRNVAGVIIVDFIDMESRRDQLQVLEHFSKALKPDKSHPQIAQLTELGLVELTRKRQGQSLYEVFGHSCPTCDGLGLLATLPGEKEEVVPMSAESLRGELSDITEEEDFSLTSEEDTEEDEKEADLTPHPTFRSERRSSGRSSGTTRAAGREPRTEQRPERGRGPERTTTPPAEPEERVRREVTPRAEDRGAADRNRRNRNRNNAPTRPPRPEAGPLT